MSELRIEFTERYLDDLPTDEEIETAKNLKLAIPEGKMKYRRVYPRLEHIDYPRELTGVKTHCELLFMDGSTMVVKGAYDDICMKIDERSKLAEQEEAND